VPVQGCGFWPKFGLGRKDELVALQLIIIAPVLELLSYAWADLKDVVWCHCHVAEIKQAMDISAQQESVRDRVFASFGIRPDMCSV
jgi:hypothetical protein